MDAVIIGHGRSVIGRGWGTTIDKAGFVVRMYNCSWQNETDYGMRYDAGLFIINQGYSFTNWPCKPVPTTWWGALIWPRFESFVETFMKRSPFVQYDATDLSSIGCSMVHDAPSRWAPARGTVATSALLDLVAGLNTIVLVGFDSFRAGKFIPSAHIPPDSARQGRRSIGREDCVVDQIVTGELGRRKGVSIRYAEDIWT